jgi:hypothetical protein
VIFDTFKTNGDGNGVDAGDAARYATYCVSPKPGQEWYQANERILALETHNGLVAPPMPALGDRAAAAAWGENIAQQMEVWTLEKRGNKPMPKSLFIGGSVSFAAREVTVEQAMAIAREGVESVMGGNRPLVLTAHGDTENIHVHFEAATTDDRGRIWNPRFDFRLWELEAERLELKYGLVRVQQRRAVAERDQDPAREISVSRPSNKEMHMGKRTGQPSVKQRLHVAIDEALANGRNLQQFVQHLEAAGVSVRVNMAKSTDRVNGLKFSLANGKGPEISGSSFGKAYGWGRLAGRLNFQPQDIPFLRNLENSVDVEASEDRKQAYKARLLEKHYQSQIRDDLRMVIGSIRFPAAEGKPLTIRLRGGAGQVTDHGDRLTCRAGEDAEIAAMIEMARIKGWGRVTLTGKPDFQRRAAKAYRLSGIQVAGHESPIHPSIIERKVHESHLGKNRPIPPAIRRNRLLHLSELPVVRFSQRSKSLLPTDVRDHLGDIGAERDRTLRRSNTDAVSKQALPVTKEQRIHELKAVVADAKPTERKALELIVQSQQTQSHNDERSSKSWQQRTE